MRNKEFDLIAYGATGYTGRLVAEYLNKQYGNSAEISWAMAGRSEEKLSSARDEVGLPSDTPFIVADADDPASLEAMVNKGKVIITTVGPYQLYGEKLLAACVSAGTDYVDLCGEPGWMHEMIEKYDSAAKTSGARIVFSCGFDSIPFDLGVFYLQEHAKKTLGHSLQRVKGRVRQMKGTFSGGTAASMKATMAAAFKDPDLLNVLKNPFALTQGFTGPKQPSGTKPMHDSAIDMWVAPFIMAAINVKNLHRSNYLLGHPYGENFTYDEMMITGPGEKGEEMAKAVASDPTGGMSSDIKPGEGPTKEERETGFYDILFVGEHEEQVVLKTSVYGDKDPGYGSTSKMIAESAICLTKESADRVGGVHTPASAMGSTLIKRLEDKAGLTFKIE